MASRRSFIIRKAFHDGAADGQEDENGLMEGRVPTSPIVVFEGVVRNQSQGRSTLFLEYEGYEPMALIKMREIGSIIRKRWEVGKIGIVHRLGRLEIGEASVVIVVTAPHRAAAFEACRCAIDTLKLIVPIWKKEHFADGSVWIEGR